MLIKIGDAWVDPQEIAAMREELDDVNDKHYIVTRFKNAGDDFLIESTMDEAEAALTDAGVIEYPTTDEVPELTDAELEELMGLEGLGFEYVARDADGKLYAYSNKPVKDGAYWDAGDSKIAKLKEDFDFIDDSEPWSIAWLLCG